MRKRLLILLLALSPTFAESCMDRGAGDPLSIKYVRDIVADTTSSGYDRIRKCGIDGVNGSITVFGPSAGTFFLSEKLLTCDNFDNVDGRAIPDGLPDFAGETVAVVSDLANEPYYGYLRKSNSEFLREIAVRSFFDLIDTTALVSQYDRKLGERKAGAKIVVLSSSYLSAFGYYDINSLLKASGRNIHVISPAHSMLRYAFARHGAGMNLAVWTTPEIVEAGIYPAVNNSLSVDYPELNYEVLCPGQGLANDRIISFLRQYKASGRTAALDAAIVDDISLPAADLNSALNDLWDNVDDSLIVYKSLISDNFEFIDAATAVIAECEKTMRASNLFTHRIAYPAAEFYATIPVPGMAQADYDGGGFYIDEFKYNRAPSSDQDTFVLVKMKSRTLPESLADELRALTPTMFENYVSD
ncbi:MAG: hypothetical protein ACI4UJ_03605 [Candidatus Cryptobacteroides sp.]